MPFLYKKSIRTAVVLLVLGMFAVWFWGWESIRFDARDTEIGKKVIFTGTMLYLNNIPDNMAGDFIAKKYGAMIQNAQSWANFESFFPDVLIQSINCDDVFSVEGVFYIEQHGFLSTAFRGDLKLFVLSSANYKTSVISRGDYESYSKDIDSIVNNNDCFTTDN